MRSRMVVGAGAANEALAGLARRMSGAGRVLTAVIRQATERIWSAFERGLERSRGIGVRRRRMRVVESLALGGRRHLLLVTCDDQEYLVGTGAESVETIVARQPMPGLVGQNLVGQGLAGQAQMVPGQMPSFPQGVPAKVGTSRVTRPAASRREHDATRPWLVGRSENRVREAEAGGKHVAGLPARETTGMAAGQAAGQASGPALGPWQ